jgi:SWI/SNF-related matrix-associated actin-dependent regulator 1 of chromatin subfamily A
LEEVDKVVVFAYHKDVIEGLKNGLESHSPVTISGDTASSKRQEVVDRFQTDPKTRVFIGQITAAGTGITLTAASTVVFVETSWVPGEIAQAEDRCHRIGQKDSVLVQFLVFAGTLEEHQLRAVVDKKITIEKIVDDRHPDYIFS